jgi:hypothetical protein
MFGNGVFNLESEALSSLRLLERELEAKATGTDLDGVIEYKLSYNPSDGLLLDLLEAFEQTVQTDWTSFWRYLAGLDPMPDFLQDILKEMASAADAAVVQANPAVQKHIANYNTLLSEGNKVVLVAHSQGNLFANIAYLGIYPEYINSFGVVSVGTPDNYVAGDGPYTTLDEDIVIGNVPASLPANINNFFGINWHDWSGHKFADSYMASGRQAETKILDDTIDTINKLSAPPYTPVTIAIRLYGQLYDPSGSWQYKTGDPGYLLWNSECDKPLQVKKTGGGFWSYPLTEAEYNGDFLADLRLVSGTGTAVNSTLYPLLRANDVETNMRDGVPNYARPMRTSSLATEQNWRPSYEDKILHTVYYEGWKGADLDTKAAAAIVELKQYIEDHRVRSWTNYFSEPNGSAVNSAGITDTWSEDQEGAYSFENNLETFWFFGECSGSYGSDYRDCYKHGYLRSPGDVEELHSGSKSLSFNAPVGGITEDFYVGYRDGYRDTWTSTALPPPATIDAKILSVTNNSGAADLVIGAEIDYSGSMTYASSMVNEPYNATIRKSITTVASSVIASGTGTVTGLSGDPVNISLDYIESAPALTSDGKSNTWSWFPGYSATRSVQYVNTEVEVSSAYDLTDNLQTIIIIETMEKGDGDTFMIPPPTPASTHRGLRATESTPVYSNLSTDYSTQAISSIVPDANTQDPWSLPNNTLLENKIDQMIALYLAGNPTGEDNHWELQTNIKKVTWE